MCYSRPKVYTYTPNVVSPVYFVSLWRRKSQILPFFGLRHFVVSPAGGNLRKLNSHAPVFNEHGCMTANLPLPSVIKSVSILQQLHGEIVCRNSVVQKRHGQPDRQTNRQTKNSTFLDTLAAGEIRASPNLAR